MNRAIDWQDALELSVPMDRLGDAFRVALKNHTSTFPVNAFGVLAAWKQIEVEEKEARVLAEKEERKNNPAAYCPNKSEHVNDDAEVELINLKNTSEMILLPCKACRPRAHDEARTRWIEKNGGFDPRPEEVLDILKTVVRPTRLTIPETDLEIIVRASSEVGQEILRDPNSFEHRKAKETLANAWKYCYESGNDKLIKKED